MLPVTYSDRVPDNARLYRSLARTTALTHRRTGTHIKMIYRRVLFAVDFDIDERRVQYARDLIVFKRFLCHKSVCRLLVPGSGYKKLLDWFYLFH